MFRLNFPWNLRFLSHALKYIILIKTSCEAATLTDLRLMKLAEEEGVEEEVGACLPHQMWARLGRTPPSP